MARPKYHIGANFVGLEVVRRVKGQSLGLGVRLTQIVWVG
jgi:hypothetical protein